MATLDDIPILPPTTPTTDDLIAVIDGGDRRSPKQVSLAQLGDLIGGGSVTAASIAAALDGGTADQKRNTQTAIGINAFYVSQYGASPAAAAAANVAAIQAALNAANAAGGGIVIIDEAGTYDVNATSFIHSHTHLAGVPGVILRKTGAAGSFGEILCNYGAATRTTDSRIRISGIEFQVNGVDKISHIVPGLRGVVSLYHVENIILEDLFFSDLATGQFGLHVSNFRSLSGTRLRATGDKDAFHLGPGIDATFDDCEADTLDDFFGCQPADYPTANPETGNIESLTFRNCRYKSAPSQPGYFFRSVVGAWAAWGSGQDYLIGRRCVNSGNVYICTGPGTAATASVAPTHTSGSVTGADGITWRFDHTGTNTAAVVRNVRFIDCENTSRHAFCEIAGEDVGFNMCITPGEHDHAFAEKIVFSNVRHAPIVASAFIQGKSWIKDATISNCHVSNASRLYSATPATGYTASTDPLPAHQTTLILTGNTLADANSGSILANRQNLTVSVDASSNVGTFLAVVGHTGRVKVKGSNPVAVLADLGGVEEKTTLPGLAYRFRRWIPADLLHPARWMLRTGNTGATGTAATAAAEDSYVDLNAGTAAGNIAWSRYARTWNQHHAIVGQGFKFADPFTIMGSFSGQINVASGGLVRFVISGPDSPARANEPALVSAGVAIEFGTDGGNQSARLVWHDGTTYFEGSWVNFGITPASQRNFRWALSNLGNGTYHLWLACGNNAMTELPVEPSVTITTGPSGIGSNANRWVGYAAVARTDIAPTTNAIRVICYPSHLDFSKPS